MPISSRGLCDRTSFALRDPPPAIPERPVGAVHNQFSDFDGLARAIANTSDHVQRALNDASENRKELEAMIDSMQDAVVAVDPAGRIQWSKSADAAVDPRNLRE